MSHAEERRAPITIAEALTWIEHWLLVLHPGGFPETLRTIRADAPARDRAYRVLALCGHLKHESLDWLRQLLVECEGVAR